jgi:hypothetical protein
MSIPTLPAFFDMYYTEKDGRLAPDGYLYNDQMFQALNLAVILLNLTVNSAIINSPNGNTIVSNGIVAPSFTTAQITALVPTAIVGTIWFNTTLSKLQVLTAAATVETITST